MLKKIKKNLKKEINRIQDLYAILDSISDISDESSWCLEGRIWMNGTDLLGTQFNLRISPHPSTLPIFLPPASLSYHHLLLRLSNPVFMLPSLPYSIYFKSSSQKDPVPLLLKTLHKLPTSFRVNSKVLAVTRKAPQGLHRLCFRIPSDLTAYHFPWALSGHPFCLGLASFSQPQGSLPHFCSNSTSSEILLLSISWSPLYFSS